ncbi:putative leader peptide [Streptomyces sp. NPDC088254]|uniref:putative leader peptide n=1 Tax=Streptomyces sp. NPDC088254 TaxID=3365847 RepID=UPI003817B769
MPDSTPVRRFGEWNGSPLRETALTMVGPSGYVSGMLRSAFLTTRGHIDLLRVASAACRRGC